MYIYIYIYILYLYNNYYIDSNKYSMCCSDWAAGTATAPAAYKFLSLFSFIYISILLNA